METNVSVAKELPRFVIGRSECAHYLGVSMRTIDEWRFRENDPLPYYNSGKKCLFIVDMVNAWFTRQVENQIRKVEL